MNYQLPRFIQYDERISTLPSLEQASCYLSNKDIDIYDVKSFSPQQFIFDNENGTIRPWHPEYPIMSIPPIPIPLLNIQKKFLY
jgi:hypothetical protein